MPIKLGEGHLDLWRHGPYLVDRCQRTSDAAVFAIGDCATVYNNATRGTDYIALIPMPGALALWLAQRLRHAAGGSGVQGSNGISIWGWNMFSTGLSLKKARALGYDAAATDREDWQKASFIESGNYKTWLRVVYDRATRRILVPELASSQDVSMACTCSRWLSSRAIPSTSLLLDIFLPAAFQCAVQLYHHGCPGRTMTHAAQRGRRQAEKGR